MLHRLLLALLLVAAAAAARAETWEFSPEVAEYVGGQVGEPVSCLCRRFSELKAGDTGECSASAESGHRWTVKYRVEADSSITILAIERQPDAAPVWQWIGRVAKVVNRFLGLFATLFAVAALLLFWRAFLLHERSFVTPQLEIVPRQSVRFGTPGTHVLSIERVGFTTELQRNVRSGLWDPVAGQYVVSRPAWSSRRNLAGRMAWQAFDVPRAGEYQLVLDGLQGPYQDRMIFSRPRSAAVFFSMLLGFGCAVTALFLTIFLMSGTRL